MSRRVNRLSSPSCAVFWLLVASATCEAQVYIGQAAPRRGSVEMSGGGLFQGGKDLPDQPATLTRNPSTGTGPFELFESDASLGSAFGVQARLGYYLSSALSLEGGVQVARPTFEVGLSDDAEGAPDVVASESITSYLFTGSVLYHFGASPRLRPFVAAGAGHVRDVHAGNEVVATGVEYHAGGGIKSWFGSGRRRFGIRADVLLSIRDGGFAADEDRRTVPTVAFSLAYLF